MLCVNHLIRRIGAVGAVAFLSLLGMGIKSDLSAGMQFHGVRTDGASRAFESIPTTRVVGGGFTSNSKYPWQALLRIVSAEQTAICGGSLIHPLIVITAAHCLVDHSGNFKRDLEVSVWLGDTELFEGNEVHEGVLFTAPSGYNPDAHPSTPEVLDFALVTLDSPSSQPRILLAGPDERALWTAGRDAYVSGWGSTFEGGGESQYLMEARTPIIDDGICGQPGIHGSRFVFSVMVCAGYLAGGVDTCQGDSGGPLQSPIDGGGFRLTGVTSWGNGCARQDSPGVYTRIAADSMESIVLQGVSMIEQAEGFPSEYRGIGVIGSGARPPGCAAAEEALVSATLDAQASLQATRVATGVFRKAGKRLRRAIKDVRVARRLRGPAKRLTRASKKLRKARKHEQTVSQVLTRDRAQLTRVNSALREALERRNMVCG
jgi:Trypsin